MSTHGNDKGLATRREIIRRFMILTVMALEIVALPAHAVFPDKAVRIIVPFAPGGGTDLIARTLAIGMSQDLGQSVIVENKPGAGTIIGSDYVARSAPDGYTVVLATFAHAVNPALQPNLPYSTNEAFAPIILVGRSPNVLVVRPDRPYKTVPELLAAAKAKPRQLTYGSQGNGTSAHLAGELFASMGHLELIHVPYRGAAPALTDLLGGQIDMMFATISAVTPYIQSGRLRALAVTTDKRSSALPDVPTLAEVGVPGYAAESWYGLYAPAGTPPAVIARLGAAAKAAMQSEVFRSRVQDEGLTVAPGPPEELERYVRGEEARWKKVVQDAHITAEGQ
jgi:tripartite-type tricarboxylate transporter receptor subunit TctC